MTQTQTQTWDSGRVKEDESESDGFRAGPPHAVVPASSLSASLHVFTSSMRFLPSLSSVLSDKFREPQSRFLRR